jgi:NAD(P)-dependent dehydrogenase (short-subunit alcohol dehydrogenase family)
MSKVWLITGSGRGLGRAILEAAINNGDCVVATARKLESLLDVRSRYGNKIHPLVLDVTDEIAAQSAVDLTMKNFGRLDIVVNNAGYGSVVPFEQTSAASFRAQIETNLYGVINLARAAVPVMRRQRAGHIINVSSVGGRSGTPGLSAYQAAKWAVGGFTEVLAKEVATFGVKVISLEPGGMRTDWGFKATKDAPALLPEYETSVGAALKMLTAYAGHEVGDPEKIAKLVVDLTSHETLPSHLLLGSDALFVCHQADSVRQKATSEWAKVSASTDFDDTDLSLLAKLVQP